METRCHREQLIDILQRAYSGEYAAAHAYRGHWRSLKKTAERRQIQQIEREEWVHREVVGRMLQQLNAQPSNPLEVRLWLIGHVIGAACHCIGWFLPMYFAGRLEHGNVDEYSRAASHADHLGLSEQVAELRHMAEVERQHECYFLSVIVGHRLLPLMQAIFKWGGDAQTAMPEPLASAATAGDEQRPIS
jgi:demethoxyubiquinone hydroxylase (CLK1/Coq7/Cat5 family)